MTREGSRSGGPGGIGAGLALAAWALLLGVGPADGQPVCGQVALPVPTVELSTESRQNTLTWDDIAVTDGRAVTGLAFYYSESETTITPNGSGGFDTTVVSVPASSPDGFPAPAPPIDLVGEYIGSCDYFLRVTKEARTGFDSPNTVPPRDVFVVLKYQLWLNTQSIGSPEYEDTLSFRQAGTEFLSPAGLGDIGIGLTLNDNVDQPTTPLGSIPVTISGLGTGLGAQRSYLVTALAPGGFGPATSGSLMVRVLGPYQKTSQLPIGQLGRDTTFVATASGTPIKVMDGMYMTFGQGSAAPGDTCAWGARYLFPSGSKVEANLQAFEGYHVWRADLPNVDSGFTLLGEIAQCAETKSFALQDVDPDENAQLDIQLFYDAATRVFRVVDHDVHDDFPYRYAVSTFDRGFLGNQLDITCEGELAETGKIYPAPQVRNPDRKVYTVPNPYKRSAAWQERGEGKIVFANLPPQCTIRIFTVAADHVATIEHGPGQPRSTSPTSTSWDLVSERGQDVVPGIYIYYVESPDGFRQTGKMIIAR